ncbi:MAG: nucleotidyltransferase family protein [Castellaniella sp.]|uniref:N-acetylmuramate alpha-1-phosphate uridylyltransferase MurU n=1 Tax=Castellaniella sp. TaxID=1955812 RepID=UPI002A36BB3F|nr:nucleotidyltransferase family protein [Castellaniella sp.]MDY0308724.1 nucleotidyltransferase family protein [Castellaniella sp.]
MRAMILAAGRGERMRPLTDTCPKPLLPVGDRPLIAWHLEHLARAGITDILVNHAWLGERIEAALGDGRAYGVQLRYSAESPALETAGGIARALPFFRGRPFLVMNGDIWCDWDPSRAIRLAATWPAERLAHLVLVDNPAHHPEGDFALQANNRVAPRPDATTPTLTFAGIGVYHPSLFADTDPNRAAPLAPLLRRAMAARAVSGERHGGRWIDVGTPERLAALDATLAGRPV